MSTQPLPDTRRAIFLDRDGTLNRDRGFVHRAEDLELLDHVIPGLRRIAQRGFRLFITTNQSGVARGYFSEAQMHAFHAELCRRLADEGVAIEAVYACVFHPTEGIGQYRRDSPLRKPRPGMILQAAAEHDLDLAASFAIGDKRSDVLAGKAAGCRTILLSTLSIAANVDEPCARPDFVADNLLEAARAIERATGGPAWGMPASDAASAFGGGSGWEHSESVP